MKPLIRAIATGGLLLAALLTTGCSHSAKQSTEQKKVKANSLTIWHMQDDPSIFFNLTELFKDNTGATITLVEKNEASIETELLEALANNQGPDVVLLKTEWLTKHQDKLIPAPDSLLSAAQLRTLYLPAVAERNIINDQVYGVTLGVDPLTIFTNEKALDDARLRHIKLVGDRVGEESFLLRPPTTWLELRDQVRAAVVKRGVFIDVAGVAIGTGSNSPNTAEVYAQLVFSNKGEVIRADQRAAAFQVTDDLGKRPGLAALDFYSSFADPAHPNYSWNTGIGNAYDRFAEGKLIYLLGFSSDHKELLKRNKDLRIVRSPAPRGDKLDASFAVVRGTSFAVTRTTSNQELAWQFVSYLTDVSRIGQYISITQKLSPLKPPAEDLALPDRLEVRTYPQGNNPEAFTATIAAMLTQAPSQRGNLSALLETTADQITDLLNQPDEVRATEPTVNGLP